MHKKGKIVFTIVIGVVCFLLVMIMSMQFKIVYQTDITSIDNMRKDELEEELASWKTKYEEVESKYKEVYETLVKYNEESSSDSETKKNLENELENLNLLLGKTNVEGKGIEIVFSDSSEDAKTIDADQLMIIVNYLRNAGAEAISINDERVINSTDFYTITEGFNKMNGQRIVSPYVIKAIGEPDYLKGYLTEYAKTVRGEGYKQEISFEEKKKVEILAYTGEFTTKYIEE